MSDGRWLYVGVSFALGIALGVQIAVISNQKKSDGLVGSDKAQSADRQWRPQRTVSAPGNLSFEKSNQGGGGGRPSLRGASGEYVLASERPHIAARLEEQVRREIERERAAHDGEYQALFERLGVDPQTNSQLRRHIFEIYKAKIRAAQHSTQVVYAQADFDLQVEALLGAENYKVYRDYEAGARARREYAIVEEFALSDGTSVDADEKAQIEKLMQSHKAYSMKTLSTLGAPYDPIPETFGGKSFIPIMDARKATLTQQAAALLHEARTAGLQEQSLTLLEKYYGSQIAAYEAVIEHAASRARPTGPSASGMVTSHSAGPQMQAVTQAESMLKILRERKAEADPVQ